MKIEINKGCFGEDVRINGESLHKHEYDTRSDYEIGSLQQMILDELADIKSDLDMHDWAEIAQILASRSRKFEYDVENSQDYSACDQCGDCGWNYTYIKKIENMDEGNNIS